MSAEEQRRGVALRLAVLCGLLGGSGGGDVLAEEEEAPELEFLEYLGSWEESDEDWLLFKAVDSEPVKETEERIDPAPTGEESTETEDET
jgi:hypothetical protein